MQNQNFDENQYKCDDFCYFFFNFAPGTDQGDRFRFAVATDAQGEEELNTALNDAIAGVDQKSCEMMPKSFKMVPWSYLGASRERCLKKQLQLVKKEQKRHLESFLDPGSDVRSIYFCMFFGYLPRTTFGRFGSPKGLQNGSFWKSISSLFLET